MSVKKIPEPETPAVSMSPAPTAKERVKKMFSAKRLALMAVFARSLFRRQPVRVPHFPHGGKLAQTRFWKRVYHAHRLSFRARRRRAPCVS